MLQKTAKRNIVRHPAKLSNILDFRHTQALLRRMDPYIFGNLRDSCI